MGNIHTNAPKQLESKVVQKSINVYEEQEKRYSLINKEYKIDGGCIKNQTRYEELMEMISREF